LYADSTTGASAPSVPKGAKTLAAQMADTLGADIGSIGKVLKSLLSTDVLSAALVFVAFAFAVYIVLRPVVCGFRAKRELLGASPSGDLYGLERSVFKALGTRAPREFPFDLAILALMAVFPITLGIYLIHGAHLPVETYVAISLLWLALARLAWLGREWWRRQRPPEPVPPYVIALPGGPRALVRDPITTAALAVAVPYYRSYWAFVTVAALLRIIDGRGPQTPARIFTPLLRVVLAGACAVALCPYGRVLLVPALVTIALVLALARLVDRPVGRRRSDRVALLAASLALVTGWLPVSSLDAVVMPGVNPVPFPDAYYSYVHALRTGIWWHLPTLNLHLSSAGTYVIDLRVIGLILLSPVAMWYAQRRVNRALMSAARPEEAAAVSSVAEDSGPLRRGRSVAFARG
jgi:hypothetical protein